MQKILGKIIIGLIILIWLLHLVQVFTPEVGFDAVWYHLPVVRTILEQHQLVFIPNLYQSVNPLLSDLVFGIGFFLAGELGSKGVAYLFGLALIVASYVLSRKFLSQFWSLVVILVVSTFQVVAWQAASFYVDVAKAAWELGSLVFLVKWQVDQRQKWLMIAALLFGASLATKLFSLFLLPVFLGLVLMWSQRDKVNHLLSFLLTSLVLPSWFYLFAYLKTGNLFYSFSQHLIKLEEIGGDSSLISYLLERTILLPTLPMKLIFANDYTSFLLILFLPILLLFTQKIKANPLLFGMVIFTMGQILIWWYLPPLSTRYALAGFVTWTVLSIWSVAELSTQHPRFYKPILVTIFLSLTINLAPRIMVTLRSSQYLLGKQTKEQYIRQFFDGNIDQHLINWYQLD